MTTPWVTDLRNPFEYGRELDRAELVDRETELAEIAATIRNRGNTDRQAGGSCRSIAETMRESVGSTEEANAAASVPSRPTRYL